MRCTESIVDIDVRKRSKFLCEHCIVLGFFSVEADVLKEQCLPIVYRRDSTLHRLTDAIINVCYASAEFLAEGYGDWFSRGSASRSVAEPTSGLPKCVTKIILASALMSARSVGKAAVIRVSSVIFPSFIGTLKSTRTRTRFPVTSISFNSSFATGLSRFSGSLDPLQVLPCAIETLIFTQNSPLLLQVVPLQRVPLLVERSSPIRQ